MRRKTFTFYSFALEVELFLLIIHYSLFILHFLTFRSSLIILNSRPPLDKIFLSTKIKGANYERLNDFMF